MVLRRSRAIIMHTRGQISNFRPGIYFDARKLGLYPAKDYINIDAL